MLRQRLSVEQEMAALGGRLRLLPDSIFALKFSASTSHKTKTTEAFPQCSCELLDRLILSSLTHSLWSCTLNDCGQGLLSPGCGEVEPCVLKGR